MTRRGQEGPVARHYAAFVIRHLHRTDGDRRITIEYPRTGAIDTVAGVEAAVVWLGAHSSAPLPHPR